ncbi:MAG TPA: nicotinate-nucleotide adenylyltransferase [Ignavibacteriaceae bacterium]|nr:nicotinate-nucleotide adenylyltransferase [Ignavibacteriaceae bacterium]
MSAVGIFGGTFDPPHIGHLITARSVLEIRKLQKIIFIPNGISPNKKYRGGACAHDRLKMLKLSIEGVTHFEYSKIEIDDPEVSYTINTLRKLKNLYDEIELIIGYDNLLEFSAWKEPDEILKCAKLVVLQRNTVRKPLRKDKFYRAAVFVDTPVVEISATEIRRRVKNGLPIDYLVADKVKEYIYKFNLYKE